MINLGYQLNLFKAIVTGIIHVGANDGAEYEEYTKITAGPVVLIEAIPALADGLKSKLLANRKDVVLQSVCSDRSGDFVKFNIASNSGQSSSILPLSKHSELHPEIVYSDAIELRTDTLEDIIRQHPEARTANVLVVDTQGADLKVLRGCAQNIDQFDVILVEVSEEALYEGGCTFKEIFSYLNEAGFSLRAFEYNYLLYGDAIFMRRGRKSVDLYEKNIAKEGRISSSTTYGIWPPERAVNSDMSQEIGFHSSDEDEPWWMVEFDSPREISTVIVVDRTSYEYRGVDLVVEARETEDSDWRLLSARKDIWPEPRKVFQAPCYSQVRAVRIRLTKPGIINIQQIILTKLTLD